MNCTNRNKTAHKIREDICEIVKLFCLTKDQLETNTICPTQNHHPILIPTTTDQLKRYFPITFGTNATTFDTKDGSMSLQSSTDNCVVVGDQLQGSPTNDKIAQPLLIKKENSCDIGVNSPDIS